MRWLEVLSIAALAGCARFPDVTHSYYPAASSSTITITQSVDCNPAQTQMFTSEAAQVSTTYKSDLSAAPFTMHIKDLDGFFADSDLKFSRTEDGRLQAIDQSTTGQGAAIVKAAVSLVASAAALGAGPPTAPRVLPECKTLAKAGGGKPVTLTYIITVDLSKQETANIALDKSPTDQALYEALAVGGNLPPLDARMTKHPIFTSVAEAVGDGPSVTLQKTEGIDLNFRRSGIVFANSFVVVPTSETFKLPIPTAAIFGKQSFSLVLAPSGAITSVEYGKTTGAADAGASLAAALSAPGSAETSIVAELKTRGDITAQTQRDVRCKANRTTCT